MGRQIHIPNATYATLDGSVFTNDEQIADLVLKRDLKPAARRNGWIIRNPKKYTHIPQIQAALEDRKAQISMFALSRARSYSPSSQSEA
jgi:hypothetical protein